MSVKKDIFTQIGAHLMAALQNYDPVNFPNGIFTTDMNLPGLKWFDKQMGQFAHSQNSYTLPLPCILMEYKQFKWETVGKNQQRGNGIIKFYIYFENYADTFTGSANQATALQFYDFTEQVNLALQGYGLPNMVALLRVTDNEDSAEDMIITSTVEYGTIITDASTAEARNFSMVAPGVSVAKVDTITRPVRGGFIDGFVV